MQNQITELQQKFTQLTHASRRTEISLREFRTQHETVWIPRVEGCEKATSELNERTGSLEYAHRGTQENFGKLTSKCDYNGTRLALQVEKMERVERQTDKCAAALEIVRDKLMALNSSTSKPQRRAVDLSAANDVEETSPRRTKLPEPIPKGFLDVFLYFFKLTLKLFSEMFI